VATAVAVVMVVALALAIGLGRADDDEPIFSMSEVEAAFDDVGLDVEPAGGAGVFLEPTGEEDFSIAVFDDAEEASWSFDELERQRGSIRESLESVGAPTGRTLLRRANVLVYDDREVSRETQGEIEQALERLARTEG